MKNLSLSWQAPPTPPLACSLMFASNCVHNIQKGTGVHSHDFWQMELVTGGRVVCHIQGQSHNLKTGQAILIPPGHEHSLDYPTKNSRWLSLKFQIIGLDNCDVATSTNPDTLASRLLAELATLYRKQTVPTIKLRMATEALLCAIVGEIYTDKFVTTPSELLGKVERIIAERICQPIGVEEVASAVGYSANHLGVRIREQLGKTLKEHIDTMRASHARHLLLFTNRSIGQISSEMGFDNIYAFSRFFKRVTSQTPSSVRRK